MSNRTVVIILVTNVLLLASLAFALGYLFGEDQKTPIVVEKCSGLNEY